jgi:hypothetical protein
MFSGPAFGAGPNFLLSVSCAINLSCFGRVIPEIYRMKRWILCFSLLFLAAGSKAQQIDSIYFHLYTDSLKRGTHNYINVDGKLSNGTWLPLTEKEILFEASACQFSGNELIVPANFSGEKITVSATLRNKPSMRIETTIWIKKID